MVKKKEAGFTIVEILISAVVVSVSVICTVAMVRTAQEMNTLDRHRRAARLVIDKYLEQTKYQQVGYAALGSGTTTSIVTLDSLSTGKLEGVMTDSISASQAKAGEKSITTPYKNVVLTVRWREWGSKDLSEVRVEKMVSP